MWASSLCILFCFLPFLVVLTHILYAPQRCYFQSKFHRSFKFQSAYGKVLEFFPYVHRTHSLNKSFIVDIQVKPSKWWPCERCAMWVSEIKVKKILFPQTAVDAFMPSAINSNLTTSCTNLSPYSNLNTPKCISVHEHHFSKSFPYKCEVVESNSNPGNDGR